MESLKALKSFQIRSLNVTFALMIGVLSTHASDIYAVLGTDASKVYLRAGEIRLEYRYNMESVDSGHSNGYTDVNVEVADQQGKNLVRETNNTNFGSGLGKVFRSKFYNPIDQWVTIRGWGGEAVTARGGGGSFFIVAGRNYVLGGDTPPSSRTQAPGPSPPPAVTNLPARSEVHAVIISGLSDPAQIVRGNVNLVGGVIALGSGDQNTLGFAGRWDPNLKITPDPELLNGDKIPPLTPNVFDVRIMHYEIQATIEANPK